MKTLKPLFKGFSKAAFMLVCLISFSPIVAKVNFQETYNITRAREEYIKDNYETAKEFIDKELNDNPKNYYALILLALINSETNLYEEVFPNIDLALKLIPKKEKNNFSVAYTVRGETNLALGDTAAAYIDFNKGLGFNPDNNLIHERLAQVYFEQGNYAESDKNYQRLIEINPGDYRGYMGIGRNNIERENYDKAVEMFSKVIKMFPDYDSGYSFRADAELKQGNYVEAADDIMKALEIGQDSKAQYLLTQFPDDKLPLLNAKLKGMAVKNPYQAIWPYYMAIIYKDRRDYKAAIEEINKAYEIDAHPVFLQMLADCYQELSDFNMALNYVNRALEMQPDDLQLISTKADILGEAGDIDSAIRTWSEFIDLKPDYWGGYYRRGFFEDNDNRVDEALEDYDMAITLAPDKAYPWLGKADMHMRKGESHKALEAYKKVLELDTVPVVGISCAMYAFQAIGEKEKGIEFMEKLIEADPSDPGVYYDGACFYARLGELEKSLSNLKIAMDKGYRKFHHIMIDDDLEELRKTPGFQELMDQYKDKIEDAKLTATNSKGKDTDEITENVDLVEVPFTPDSGCASVKCTINELPLTFLFDTGASYVSISQLEANFMLKNGYLKPSDFVGTGRFIDANGDVSEGSVINLRNVEFGGLNLSNVKASVVRNQKAPLLLGQSVLGRLGSIEIDNNNKKLIIRK